MADLSSIYRAARYRQPLREQLNPLQSLFFEVCQGPSNAPLAWGAILAAIGALLFVGIVRLSVPGSIKVVSEPAGAEVVVDGVSKGQAPLVLRDLPRGRHHVELRQNAFQPKVLTVDIGAFSPSYYKAKLAPVPAKPVIVDQRAATTPDRLALWWVGQNEQRQVTWSEISARSDAVAQGLADLGLRQGDRVLVLLPRIIPWWKHCWRC